MYVPPTHRSRRRRQPISLFNLLIPIGALLALGILVAYAAGTGSDQLTLHVVGPDDASLEQAVVSFNGKQYVTDSKGRVTLDRTGKNSTVDVHKDGYSSVRGEYGPDHSDDQTVKLEKAESPAPAESTPNAGSNQIDPNAQIGPTSTPINEQATAAALTSPVASLPATTNGEIAGTVADESGKAVPFAWVTDGKTIVYTDKDGVFRFDPGVVTANADLTVTSSGFKQTKVNTGDGKTTLHVKLSAEPIRGLYFNPNISNTPEKVQHFIDIANQTEVNAVVIDIKEETVYFDTKVQLFRDSKTVVPTLDVPAIIKQFHDNDIYVIARLVVFKDSQVAEMNPDLALKDERTGDLWRDMNGVAWVDPTNETLWNANIDLALEAANLGFDEIQYDYVRFPTDGDTQYIKYREENSERMRTTAIETFLQRSQDRIIPTGARLSADIFGYATVTSDDVGIGQRLTTLIEHTDYVSPMIYPSHWPEGSMAIDGAPNDHPYEAVEISMGAAIKQLPPEMVPRLRPWLQDFSLPKMGKYGDAEIKAQIDACDDLGLSGWLMWSPDNVYHDGGLKPESASALPHDTVPVMQSNAGVTRSRRQRAAVTI